MTMTPEELMAAYDEADKGGTAADPCSICGKPVSKLEALENAGEHAQCLTQWCEDEVAGWSS